MLEIKKERLTKPQLPIGRLSELQLLRPELPTPGQNERTGFDQISDLLRAEVSIEDKVDQSLGDHLESPTRRIVLRRRPEFEEVVISAYLQHSPAISRGEGC